MKPCFNLIEEPWIPCLLPDSRTREFGLLEVLVRSPEIREIFHPSPLVVTAVHRLLLAVLHRNLGPESLPAWKELYGRGGFDAAVLEGYFNRWRDRFFLFHPERPFYQVSKMAGAREHPAQKLMEEAAWGNNPTLFDHSFKEVPLVFDPAQAALYVLARQSFSLAGLAGPKHDNFTDSPLSRSYSTLVMGKTLFETLSLNLIAYNSESPIPWRGSDDPPCWEQETPRHLDKQGNLPTGYLDYLTWQSRRLHLIWNPGFQVVGCQMLQGLKIPDGFDRDPFLCYARDPERGIRPRRINPERAVWRDSHTLFAKMQEIPRKSKKGTISTKRPEIFNWLARLKRCLTYFGGYTFSVAGLSTDQAKVELWRQERLPLPLAYLEDQELLHALKVALDLTEKAHGILTWGVRSVAALILRPDADPVKKAASGKEREEINRLVNSWAPGRLYWSRLEAPFRELMVQLPEDQREDEEGEVVFGSQLLPDWRRLVAGVAERTFTEVAAGLEKTVRSHKAVARMEGRFRARLKKELLEGGES
ncbi:MAG: type I-E CRISPR-associated protein Cse1/CasA [Deltaproteobacteria bacterium]|nr:type I-E CRISPR-associated protein Cse1/CasA [Deltaproteobacteria bacterium]